MPQQDPTPRTRQRFTFFATDGRLYARNVEGKSIDLGSLSRADDGAWHWRLDGNGLTGGGTATAEAAMREAAERMGFLYLDGQFTAVADARETAARLDDGLRVEVELDELQPGERIEDARV